jgi:hypothetical protein
MSSLLGKNPNVVVAWENVKCRLCLKFLQGGGGKEDFFRTEQFFLQEGGEEEKIFSGLNFFYREEGGRRGFFSDRGFFFTGRRRGGFRDPEKGADAKRAFFPSSRASLFPQRHRDLVSRLTEGTPGGLVGKKSFFGAFSFFLGKGWGKVKKRGKIENSKNHVSLLTLFD